MFTAYRLPAALAATVVLLTTAACASGVYSRYPAQYPVETRRLDDLGYRNGYQQGLQDGAADARRGRSFDYSRHGEYRSAAAGYGGDGNRAAYQQTFRQGFASGYNDGYRRYARSDSRSPSAGPYVYGERNTSGPAYGPPAVQNGFRDGLEQGQRDRRDGHRFDPILAKRYREGDHDYNGRDGSRDDYKREYRAAFEQGYAQGYGR